MDILFLLIGIVGVVALVQSLRRPTAPSQPPIIYIPTIVTETQSSGLGCLPLAAIGVLALLVLGVIRF
jgi:hypothetical protein